MPRIRTLKPEFWDSPSTAQADLAVRLTFMAMWNWADDSGHGTANLKELEAFVFPNDEVPELPRKSRGNSAPTAGSWRNFSEICGEVAEAYGVVFYRVNGRPYYRIPNFKQHQSKDYRSTSKYPPVEEGEIFDVTSGNSINSEVRPQDSAGTSARSRGNSAPTAGESGIGTGEQGNRGTGESVAPATPDASALFEPEQTSRPVQAKKKPAPKTESIEQSVTTDAYERVGKAFSFIAVRGIVKWALHERGAEPDIVTDAVVAVYKLGKPITKQTIGQYLDGHIRSRGPAGDATRPDAPRDIKSGLLVER